jgi:peptidoglycan/xylan/chitin deacetylase (PgdA/CDA1 family)
MRPFPSHLLLTIVCVALATVHANLIKLNSASVTKRHVLARDAALATLPAHVAEELARRDPSEYELDLAPYLERSQDDENAFAAHLIKRETPTGDGETMCKSSDHISMTYDDGPFDYERSLTETFINADMKLTYFINVNNFGCAYTAPRPENLQYALANGMTIASHSGTHPDFQTLTFAQIDEQIQIVENFTWATIGVLPRFFRPPYGSTNDTINSYLNKKWGLTVVTWAVDAGDADNVAPKESVSRIKAASGGSIVLNHETHQTSVTKVAPRVIKNLKQTGSTSVNMAKCLKQSPYKARLKNHNRKRTEKWTCEGLPAAGKSNV